MSFADIRDQEIALRLLRNFIEQDRVPNGLLFWGPGGVGKNLAAMEFSKALNCKVSKFDACGECAGVGFTRGLRKGFREKLSNFRRLIGFGARHGANIGRDPKKSIAFAWFARR